MEKANKMQRYKVFLIMVLPALLIYFIFYIIPFLQTFWYSLTDWNGVGRTYNIIGLKNFAKLLHDKKLWSSLLNNVKFCVWGGIATFAISLFNAALLSHSRIKGKNIYRAIFFVSNILSITVVSLLFMFIYNPKLGILNGTLELIGLGQYAKGWLGNKATAIYCLIVPWVWMSVGYYMILFISAIEGIPVSFYESAEIDGASKWKSFWHISMPLIVETLKTALVFFFINAFSGVFTLVNIMTDGQPSGTTEVMTNYMYRIAFRNSQFGLATAVGVFVFLLVLVLSGALLLLTRQKEVIEY